MMHAQATSASADTAAWESEVAAFLDELSSTQAEMLKVLGEKRECLVRFDEPRLAAVGAREEILVERLQACLSRRAELLARAGDEGRPNGNIRQLAGSLNSPQQASLTRHVTQASSQARILQHQGLTNWVLVQRTLIHLSQMLEIIATGGRAQPTYGKGDVASSSGALVDQAA